MPTLTLPTYELVGALTDVIPFAATDKDFPPLYGVRLEWDGERLHTHATDRYRVGWSTWSPDDPPPADVEAQDPLSGWGADDEKPWACFLALPRAKEIVTVFKLPAKTAWTAVHVSLDFAELQVRRDADRDGDVSAVRLRVPTVLGLDMVDVRKTLQRTPEVTPTRRVAFRPNLLADFAKVRNNGAPMRIELAGERGAVRVRIGERFTGAIMPYRAEADLHLPYPWDDDQPPAGARESDPTLDDARDGDAE